MNRVQIVLVAVVGYAAMVSAVYTVQYELLMRPLSYKCTECMGLTPDYGKRIYKEEKLITKTDTCIQYCTYSTLGLLKGTQIAGPAKISAIYLGAHAGDLVMMSKLKLYLDDCTKQAEEAAKKNDPCYSAGVIQECFRLQK